MPFDFGNWGTIQPGGTQEFLQDGSVIGAPGMYTYQSQHETLLQLSAVDYFSPIGNTLFINDLLYLTASNGVGIFYVLAVDFETGNLIIGAESTSSGDVMGPGVSTVTAIARWNNTIGTLLSNSGVLIDNSDNITGVNDISAAGIAHLNQANILNDHQLRWYVGDDSNVLNPYVGWKANPSLTVTKMYQWPIDAPLENGQLLTANTDGTTSWTTPPGVLIWSEVTGATQTIVAGHGYFLNSGVHTTFTLPIIGNMGDTFEIRSLAGSGSSFTIAQLSGLRMQVATGLTTIGNTGSISSTSDGDMIEFTHGPTALNLWVYGACGSAGFNVV